jgi:hypothetical protein
MGSSGWAVVSAWEKVGWEGYFEGTTDGNSLFISVEKLNESQSLNFTGFYRQIPGENSPNTAEVTELTTKYNSIGVFRKVRRGMRNKTIEEPILMLNHFFKIMTIQI